MEKKQSNKKISIDKIREESNSSILRYVSGESRIPKYVRYLLLSCAFLGVSMIFGLGIRKYSQQQREIAAKEVIWPVETYLREGKYDDALEGGGGDIGLLKIIAQFGNTTVGNTAHFYAGIAYLKKKKPEIDKAIYHLKAYQEGDSLLQVRVWNLLGGIYCDREDYEEAITYYKKAANHTSNPFVAPEYLFKLAKVYEFLKEYEKAIACYARVQKLFPQCDKVEEAIKHESRLRQLSTKS